MTGRTEERLRDTTAALGQVIRPQDIPELRLPDVGQPSWHPAALARRPRWVGRRLAPLAAAAAMLALVGSLAVAGKVLGAHGPGAAPKSSPPATRRATAPPGTRVAGMPAYLVDSTWPERFLGPAAPASRSSSSRSS